LIEEVEIIAQLNRNAYCPLWYDEFIEELKKYKHIHILVSGGTESTLSALYVYNLIAMGILNPQSIELVWENTGLTMKSSRDTLEKLKELTGWPLVVLYPFYWYDSDTERKKKIKQTINYAFGQIPKCKAIKKKRPKYNTRRHLKCCQNLKDNLGKDYCKLIPLEDRTDHVFITSLTSDENQLRGFRLHWYRKRLAWIYPYGNFNDIPYARPFIFLGREQFLGEKRTENSKTVVKDELIRFGFGDTKGSGCSICPQLLLHKDYFIKKDPKGYITSRRYYMRNYEGTKFCGEIPPLLEEFIKIKV
jgi:hypothetical protein